MKIYNYIINMIEAIFFVFFIISILSLIINSSYFNYIPNMIYKTINKNSNTIMRNKLLDALDTKWIYDDINNKNN